MDYWFLQLFFLALILGLCLCVFVLPIVAFVRTRRIAELDSRLSRLEKQLGKAEPRGEPTPAAEAVSAAPPAEPRREEAPAEIRPRRPKPDFWPKWVDAAGVEAWLGRHGLGWAAVLLLLFATGFFLKHAFEHQWIDELGRVVLGVVVGIALVAAGLLYHHWGWRVFSRMLTAAGVTLLYLATYAAAGYYRLLPQEMAGIFLVVLVAETAALAVFYEAPAIALMAVVGGLLTPLLLHTGRDQYRSLFLYLLVLNAGTVGLALFRRWRAIGTVALAGTHALFWLWYTQHYHPEKLVAAIGFQAGLFGLFLAYSFAAHVVRARKADDEDLVRFVLNASLAAAAGYVLLDADYHVWMGALAVGVAALYAGLGWLVLRFRSDDPRQLLVVTATSMGFVAAAIPLQAEAAWIPVGWAVQGAALWWFAERLRSPAVRLLGLALLAMAVVRLVVVDTPYFDREPFTPLFNRYAMPASLVAACVLGAAAVGYRHLGPEKPGRSRMSDDRLLTLAVGIGGLVLVWLILSVETYTYFTAWLPQATDPEHLLRTAQAALSVAWAMYAAVVLAVGFWLASEPLRWAALVLFGGTLAKVVLVDMADLPGLYRVAAFLALSLMMAAATWGYHKVQRLAAGREEARHEPA